MIYFIVTKIQGKELDAHRAENGLFYSNWKAGGIGAVCMAIILTVVLSGIYLSEEKWDIDRYNAYVVQYGDNEQAAGLLFDKLDTLSDEENPLLKKQRTTMMNLKRSSNECLN